MSAEYRYLAYDVRTMAFRGELELGSVTFSEALNDVGELTADLDLRRPGSSELVAATEPCRIALFVDRDGVLVWGGIIWSRRRSRGSTGVVSIMARDYASYLARRLITTTLSYSEVDQLAVAQDIVTWMQSQPGGDVRIAVGTETSGVPLTAEPLAWNFEFRNVLDVLNEIATGEGGFDWSFGVAYGSSGLPEVTFRCHYPRRGRRATESNLVFFTAAANGGNMIDWALDTDGASAATTIYGIGGGEGDGMVQVAASNMALIDAGYPLTEAVIAHKAITDPDALLALALTEISDRSNAESWEIEVDPDDVSVPFGTWTVGDDARFVIEDDPLFPSIDGAPGREAVLRILGHTVSPFDDGGPDAVTLKVGRPRGV